MNLLFIIAITVLIGVAVVVVALFKNATTFAAIVAWIVAALLIILGIALAIGAQWRGFGIGSIVVGFIVFVSGIGCYKWGKVQKKEEEK